MRSDLHRLSRLKLSEKKTERFNSREIFHSKMLCYFLESTENMNRDSRHK